MNRMFGTLNGQFSVARRGLGVLGTLVSLGVCSCGGDDTAGTEPTSSVALPPAVAPVPGATSAGTPVVTPPGGMTTAAPVTPGSGQTPPPVTPPTGGVTPPNPVPVQPNVPTPPPAGSSTGATETGTDTGVVPPPPPPTPPGTGECTITASGEISSKINTVGIVTFTTDATVTSAKIEFTNMAGGDTLTAPVDLEAQNYRTLLLGMKPSATYSYKVIVNDSCTSAEGTLTTGIPPAGTVPRITQTGSGALKGFYIVSIYAGGKPSVILDQDGDIVWYGGGVSGQDGTSRSKMDWDSKYMYSIAANPFPGNGSIRKVSMDGLEDTTMVAGTDFRHHDIAALPGGTMTFLAHQSAQNPTCSRIVEVSPGGQAKEIVANIDTLYAPGSDCHPNSIHYQVEDGTYTISDRQANLYVKISRAGELVWQLGGANPKGASFSGAGTWSVNHGHHYFTQDGATHMLVFNNGMGAGGSNVFEFILDEQAMTANKIWTLPVDTTTVMGEVQRLPNDHTMVALTTKGVVREYDGDTMVNEFGTGGQVGYVDYRPTLYGPATKAFMDYKKFQE